jgi:HD-GYP domain-containing protein (c-di-GMP phosphodiesterase class II)
VNRPRPPRQDDARETATGLALVPRLNALLRAGRLYHESNRSFQRHVEEVLATLSAWPDEEVALVCMGDCFHLNGVGLRREFEERALGAVRFLPGITPEEVQAFVRVWLAARAPEQAERLPEEVAEAGVLRIVPVRARDLGQAAPAGEAAGELDFSDERARARDIFWRAVRGTGHLLAEASRTGRPAMRRARRLVQPVVDSILRDDYSVLGMMALKSHDEYTCAHCVNVSVLSVSMGHSLGLPRGTLAHLGVAALFHDLGKIAVPPEVLHKPGALTGEEWDQLRRHPLEGLRIMARMPGLAALNLDAMRVCFEHHWNADGSGYPECGERVPPSAFARIVAVADVFDALTAHRAYRRRPFTGHEALSQMAGPERHRYDPAAVWALVRSVGLFPAGTVLETESGRRVLSLSPNPADCRRPRCRLLDGPGGAPDARDAELWSPMPPHERVRRVIAPEEHGADVEMLLAA